MISPFALWRLCADHTLRERGARVAGLRLLSGSSQVVLAVANERKAREASSQRQEKERETRLARQQAAKLQSLFDQMSEGSTGEVQNVNLVIKADVQGSVEALRDALMRLSTEEIKVNVVASGGGGITEAVDEIGPRPLHGGNEGVFVGLVRCLCLLPHRPLGEHGHKGPLG